MANRRKRLSIAAATPVHSPGGGAETDRDSPMVIPHDEVSTFEWHSVERRELFALTYTPNFYASVYSAFYSTYYRGFSNYFRLMKMLNDEDVYVRGKVLVDMPGLLRRPLAQKHLLDRQVLLERRRHKVLLPPEWEATVLHNWQSTMLIA